MTRTSPGAAGVHGRDAHAADTDAAVRDDTSAASPDRVPKDVKHFVLDTNILLHNPHAMFVFEDNEVVIPFPVIEELDAMKRREDDVGRNARQCVRQLDRLRRNGRLIDGVDWGSIPEIVELGHSTGPDGVTGKVRIDVGDHERPIAIGADSPDNRIIAVAWTLQQRGLRSVFISKDLGARIKSDSLGIRTEDFENQKIDADRLYTGYRTLQLPGEIIDKLYRDKAMDIAELDAFVPEAVERAADWVLPNQYLVLHDIEDESHTGLARRLASRMADTDQLIPVTGPRKPTFGLMARNVQQTLALDLLLDDEIRLVTLIGAAGTGKTLLAVAAGMSKVFGDESRYEKLLVARPIMPMGRDIGFLPGDKDEKVGAWMQPIFDNLSYLMSTRSSPNQQADSHSGEQRIEKLIADGKLVLEPLTYIRGRSIPHQFLIIDEAQNLTPREIKTIVSRVGEGTKIVLTGDIEQIDNPYLDQSSNGLSYCIEHLKGIGIVGHITLQRSERSELASIAAELL